MSEKENLTNYVYYSLKKQIINNELLPNTYLDEKQICESLGVSRTPIREALVRLEWEGLVVPAPKRGVMVSELSLQTIIDLIHIRKVMEPGLLKPYLHCYNPEVLLDLRRRCQDVLDNIENTQVETLYTLDYEFHKYLCEATQRPHIIKLLTYVCDQSQRIRTQEFYLRRRLIGGVQDHIHIIDALLSENYDLAIQVLTKQVTDLEQYYHRILLNGVTD